jgi:hypothetical protein
MDSSILGVSVSETPSRPKSSMLNVKNVASLARNPQPATCNPRRAVTSHQRPARILLERTSLLAALSW